MSDQRLTIGVINVLETTLYRLTKSNRLRVSVALQQRPELLRVLTELVDSAHFPCEEPIEADVDDMLRLRRTDPQRFMEEFRQSPDIFNSTTPKRIKLCKHGVLRCRFGDNCGYAHSDLEVEVMNEYWRQRFKSEGSIWISPTP